MDLVSSDDDDDDERGGSLDSVDGLETPTARLI